MVCTLAKKSIYRVPSLMTLRIAVTGFFYLQPSSTTGDYCDLLSVMVDEERY